MLQLRRLFQLIFFISCATTGFAQAPAEVLKEYDANIAEAKSGKLPISSSLVKKPDIAVQDPILKGALTVLANYFAKKDFMAFLEKPSETETKVKSVSFRSVKKIGEGGFGKIFLLQLSNTVKGSKQTYDIAVKVQKSDENGTYHDRYALEVEINNMRVANYFVHMLPYYGTMMDKNQAIFILSKALDASLSAKIASHTPIEDSYLYHFIMRMGRALNDLGEALFIHNDIKDDNIMTDKDGNFYLIDLGEMRRLMPSEITNAAVEVDKLFGKAGARLTGFGSGVYKAPEKVTDDVGIAAEIDWRKSDGFSMGLVLASLILQKPANELWEECATKEVCKLPRVGLTAENFQEVKQHIKELFDAKMQGASKIRRAAMKLALQLISPKPSERPADMELAYKSLLKAEQ